MVSTNEIIAYITVTGARDVAVYLDSIIASGMTIENLREWEEVRDALYAISNDTDQIRTYDNPEAD